MELKLVNASYFKQLFQTLRPQFKYSKNRIFVTPHFGTLLRLKKGVNHDLISLSVLDLHVSYYNGVIVLCKCFWFMFIIFISHFDLIVLSNIPLDIGCYSVMPCVYSGFTNSEHPETKWSIVSCWLLQTCTLGWSHLSKFCVDSS